MRQSYEMIIRAAQPHEAQELSELCLRSKAYWPYDAAFIEACRDELTLSAADIQHGNIQVAEIAGRHAGLVQLENSCPVAELELLFVDPDFIGKRVGHALLQWAIDQVRNKGGQKLITVADP
ncbi:GNAT family N-acetyltransferase [Maritalea mediterranea]|uniref:GNAT family N-acetyltransferase n=1 Tax=Maritalea mediterranea TaxID=2909667 RepID=A0ABS9E7D3_9HYPH|nr:GNAT family N-acetyltransferase [Maritalea mediterranea]MCF4097814.1 GNAT family N-acetyltransferase [Maritalea mediterranea]